MRILLVVGCASNAAWIPYSHVQWLNIFAATLCGLQALIGKDING